MQLFKRNFFGKTKENPGFPGILSERYAVDENCDKIVVLERIAESRNCRQKGNVLDLDKASKLLIDDFRSGKLGRLTLEFPQEQKIHA